VDYSNIEQFQITGTGVADSIYTGDGNDTINGGAGNDFVDSGAGNDIIDGVNGTALSPGLSEIDNLSGGTGSDRFILGNATKAYYDDGNALTSGSSDYADITDFNIGDVIQLQGSSSNYLLSVVGFDTQILINKPGTEPDELIGIVRNQTGLSLTGSNFTYATLPTITLAVAPASVLENGTTNLIYNFTRTGATTNALTVNYSIAGTAAATDYTGATPGTGKTITFLAGSATATLTLDPTADTTVEANETVALTLATGTGYTVGTTTAVTGTITNDDFPSITLAVAPASVLEDGTPNLVYTFTRTGATTNALTVNYGITGTATNGTDYATIATSVTFIAGSSTASVTVNPTPDTTVEANETVALTLATGTGYTIGTTTAVTGTITNDDTATATVTLALAPASVSEDGTGNLVYTFTRTGATTNALTVNYTVGGTATNGIDYASITNNIIFGIGSSTVTRIINPTADTTVEANETVILTLASGTGYTIGTTTAVTGTIINDDAVTLPSITLALAPVSVLEDGTPNLIYTFTRTGATTNALTVSYGITGTATNGTDYATIGTSVTFAANSATASVTVNPTADTTIEADETVALTLATGTGYTVGTTTAVTGSITNDDFPSISLGLNYSGISENSPSNFTYTFTRTGATTNPLTVKYNLAGTALSTDYTGATPGTNKTIIFAANSATATLVLDPTADTTLETDETISLQLVAGTGYSLGTTAAQIATIINDDGTRRHKGTTGKDVLLGTTATDYLIGGAGDDNLTGGAGGDLFSFAAANLGNDRITDFAPGQDAIVVSAQGFGGGLIAGDTITAAQFLLGSTATNASQRFIYTSSTGALLFDIDGNGSQIAKLIATLNTGLALTFEDIFVS
jgi:Ca2+-binding RTX toxin-like protein